MSSGPTQYERQQDEIIRVHGLMETALAAENKNLKKFIGDYVKYTAITDDNVLLSKNNQLKTTYLLAAIAFPGDHIRCADDCMANKKGLAN